MTKPNPADVLYQLERRLKWKQALIGRGGELPSAGAAFIWALQLEVARRLREALDKGDKDRLKQLLPSALRAIQGGG